MSRIDSRKELNSVYRRCLSALNQGFKIQQPSVENCRKFETLVAEEAKKRNFAKADEQKKWAAKRYAELYHKEQARLFKDPRASLKAQIEDLIA